MTTWYVASQNPGTSTFLDAGLVAVNFWVRHPARHLDPEQVKRRATGLLETWDTQAPGTKTRFANQLTAFANEMQVGDEVVTFDPPSRTTVLVGRIVGDYQYEDPATVPDHPHVREVEWLGTTARSSLPDGGKGLEHTRGTTIRRLSTTDAAISEPLDDPPASESPVAERPRRRSTPPDTYEWSPIDGVHRHVLSQHFGGAETVDNPLVVVMLNPAANHIPGFRRSTTCRAVRTWAQPRGYDGAVYVNLFTYIEPNSRLRDVDVAALNDDRADEELARVVGEARGVVIAGWGDLPSGFSRQTHDLRVAAVRRMIDKPLMCLGLTKSGYPRHGRGWRADDAAMPLP